MKDEEKPAEGARATREKAAKTEAPGGGSRGVAMEDPGPPPVFGLGHLGLSGVIDPPNR